MEHINEIQQYRKRETYFITWEQQNQIIEAISEDITIQIVTENCENV